MRITLKAALPAIACMLICLALTLYPGDAPWGGDDATLVTTAIQANKEHRLITAGLGGSFGYPYGPLPSQIYQLLAMISHDPVTLVQLHAALFSTVTAFGLLWLTIVLGLTPWLAPITMLGPFFWFYDRLMWDNTFAIPIGTLLLAAYGDFWRRKSRYAFLIATSFAIALPLIHPMTLPLVLAVFSHALFSLIVGAGRPGIDLQNAPLADRSPAFRLGLLKNYWIGLIIVVVVAGCLNGSYILRIADQLHHSAALIPPRDDALTRPRAALFPLFSGRLFTAYGFFDQRGPEIGWEQNPHIITARYFSLIAYPLIWLGLAIALWRRSTLMIVCISAMLLQSLMDALLRISPYPHYYTGTWAATVVLLWIGFESIRPPLLRRLLMATYAISMALSTFVFALDIHHHHGGTVWYGPSISTQLNHE